MIPKLTKEQFRQVYEKGFDATFALFDALQCAVESLEKRVTQLEGILKKDSHNSSKPPSTNGFKRPPESLRGKSGKSVGGQPGHEGTTLQRVEHPDKIVKHRCHGNCVCGRSLKEAQRLDTEKRQLFEIPEIKVKVIEHQAEICLCECGRVHTAAFPEGVNAPAQYGEGIKGLVIYLMTAQLLPRQRTQQMLADILGIAMSEGTLDNICEQGYQRLEKTEEITKQRILKSEVVHADETGCDVIKKTWWIHSLSNLMHTWYYPHPKRGKDAIDAAGLLEQYRGTLVHDGWKTYLHYLCKHALCNAHHLRELVFIDEYLKESWAKEMKECLLTIKKTVDQAKEKGKHSLDPHLQDQLRRNYLLIVNRGYNVDRPEPERKPGSRGKVAQPPSINLLERLFLQIDEVLAFMYDFNIPFTNNLAERDLRMIKVKLKISGCFRSARGVEVFCRIRGYISTVRKHNLNVWEYSKKIFTANSHNVCLIPG